MNKVTLLSLAVLLNLAACTLAGDTAEEVVTVDFSARTSKSAVVDDSAIHCLDIFVYRSDTGAPEAHLRTEGLSASLELPKGVKLDWIVLANAPEGTDPTQCSKMEDNSPTSLVMSGRGSGIFTKSSSVSLKLSRLMSKVVLEKLTPSEGFSRAYLADVAGTCTYLEGPDTSKVRYNVQGADMSLNPFLIDCLVSSSCTGAEFLCYPDPLGKTSLVLEMEAPYGTDIYRARLPALKSNTTYIIKELVIESRMELRITIQINPWEEVDSSCTLE